MVGPTLPSAGASWRQEVAPRPRDRPVSLPHIERLGSELFFLGERLDPAIADRRDLALLDRCDGTKELPEFRADEQVAIARWQRAGLVVLGTDAPVESDTLVISPHPDDAVLALGGLLTARGGCVLNVFSAETWTRRPYYAQRPRLAGRMLLAEETVACRVVGARPFFLGFRDAADRPLWTESFFLDRHESGGALEAEPELRAGLQEALLPYLTGSERVYVPLGVGGHVDHLLCREIVFELVTNGQLDPGRLVFYEDQPYSLFADASLLSTMLSERLSPLRLAAEYVYLDDARIRAKTDALKCYRLQVQDGIVRRVERYARARTGQRPGVAAERIWIATP